ncbi:MAG: hypothetical protein HUJ68_09540 [Clostridia bacterium]|nr:hypothetical protein [Clostridia bacterium]
MEQTTRISTLQGRLAQRQDNLRRKIIDKSNLRNVSSPVDCILCRLKEDYRGDAQGIQIKDIDIIPVVFPGLTEVPFRRLELDEVTKKWHMTSPIEAGEEGKQDKAYTLQVPWDIPLNVDDYITRIFVDEDINDPIIVVLQVKELVGDFGGLKMIMQKCKCVIPTYSLPDDIINTIYEMGQRRLKVGF